MWLFKDKKKAAQEEADKVERNSKLVRALKLAGEVEGLAEDLRKTTTELRKALSS